MTETLLSLSSNPLLLALSLIGISWIWEDAAVISGALLASDQLISVPLSVSAVFIGICSGDLGLYYLGRSAIRWRRVRGWILTNPQSRKLSRRFKQRTLSNILLIRFIPGLRTLGFSLCGMWQVPLGRFLIAMTSAGAVWIALIFSIIYTLGSSDWLEQTPWKWALILLAAALLLANNVWAIRSRRKKTTKS